MATDYARALGSRLRAIRTQQGLSLHGVEERSTGPLEGRRRRLATSAATAPSRCSGWPSWPTSTACPSASCCRTPGGGTVVEPPPRLVIDLEALGSVPAERAGPLARYAATIQGQRGDYNGKVLSIRQDDLRTLAVIYDMPPAVAGRRADHLGRPGRRRPPGRRGPDAPARPEFGWCHPAFTAATEDVHPASAHGRLLSARPARRDTETATQRELRGGLLRCSGQRLSVGFSESSRASRPLTNCGRVVGRQLPRQRRPPR